jgi:hypothetical protein
MSQPSDSPSPSDSGQQDDPLAALHKMSRTAGLGSQEYVAVNPMAVASVLVGLLSVLALLFGTILLIIPVAAAILAIVSIVQIRRSAGTQAGVGIAILGLLIALLFVGAVGGKAALHAYEISAAQGEIVGLIDHFGRDVNQGNYDAAWDLCSSRFHDRIKKDSFTSTWAFLQSHAIYGKINLMRWSGYLDVRTDEESGQVAVGLIIIVLENKAEDRHVAYFRKENGRWRIDDIQQMPWTAAGAAPEHPQ